MEMKFKTISLTRISEKDDAYIAINALLLSQAAMVSPESTIAAKTGQYNALESSIIISALNNAIEKIRTNPLAVKVKLADLEYNSDLKRLDHERQKHK